MELFVFELPTKYLKEIYANYFEEAINKFKQEFPFIKPKIQDSSVPIPFEEEIIGHYYREVDKNGKIIRKCVKDEWEGIVSFDTVNDPNLNSSMKIQERGYSL